MSWFAHLPQYEREASLSSQLSERAENDIHPEVLNHARSPAVQHTQRFLKLEPVTVIPSIRC